MINTQAKKPRTFKQKKDQNKANIKQNKNPNATIKQTKPTIQTNNT